MNVQTSDPMTTTAPAVVASCPAVSQLDQAVRNLASSRCTNSSVARTEGLFRSSPGRVALAGKKSPWNLQWRSNAADWIAGRWIDRNALKKISCAVDQIPIGVQLKVAAAGIAVDPSKSGKFPLKPVGACTTKKPVAVDGHVGCRRRALNRPLHVVCCARVGDHAAGDLVRGDRVLPGSDRRNWCRCLCRRSFESSRYCRICFAWRRIAPAGH